MLIEKNLNLDYTN